MVESVDGGGETTVETEDLEVQIVGKRDEKGQTGKEGVDEGERGESRGSYESPDMIAHLSSTGKSAFFDQHRLT